MDYKYKRQVNVPYEEAVQKATAALKKEGFGIPSQINVAALFKEKLNVDFEKYIILGACAPPFAFQALKTERDIGLLMPCNVIVYEQESKTFVAAIKPTASMQVAGGESLRDIAEQVEQKLKKVVDSV
jgi:uncharacterized protein (DUF302 family)